MMVSLSGETSLPDMSLLSEPEKNQLIAVIEKAKEFEKYEEEMHLRQPLEGQLCKYTNVVKGWQYRWITLDPNTGMLEYYEREENKKNRPRGSLCLAGAVISPSDEDSQTFTVHAANGEIYRLKAFDAKERQHWVNRIRATVEFHVDTLTQTYPRVPISVTTEFGESMNMKSTHRSVAKTGDVHPPISLQRKFHPDKPGVVHELRPKPDLLSTVESTLQTVYNYTRDLDHRIEDLPQTVALDKDILLLRSSSHAAVTCLQQCLNIMQERKNIGPCTPSSPTEALEWISSSVSTSLRNQNDPSGKLGSHSTLRDKIVTVNHVDEEENVSEYSDTSLEDTEETKP